MSGTVFRANGIPTGAESSRVESFITEKEKVIRASEQEMILTAEKISSAKRAIHNFELIIPLAKAHLNDYLENQAALSSIESRLSTLKLDDITLVRLDDESHSRQVCGDLTKSIGLAVSRGIPIMQEQMDLVNKEVREMHSGIERLQDELSGWRFSLKLLEEEFSRLSENKKRLEATVKSAKNIFSSVRRLPSEVWVKIFQYRVDWDLDSYLDSSKVTAMTSTALLLSHVCKGWQQLVWGDPSLWQVIPGHTLNSWNADKDEVLSKMIQSRPSGTTLVVNLSSNINGKFLSSTSLKNFQSTYGGHLLAPKTYSIIVTIPANPNTVHSSIAQNIGFNDPISLTINVMPGPNHDYDFSPLPYFPSVTQLTLVGFQQFTSRSIVSTTPHLTQLSLHLTTFTNFDLVPHLPPGLESFRIRHDGTNRCSLSNPGIQLANLKVLGITPYEFEIFRDVDLPALHTIILYAAEPLVTVALADCVTYASVFCRQIQTLELNSWVSSGIPIDFDGEGSWRAVRILEELLNHTLELSLVKFDKCYVDGDQMIELLRSNRAKGNLKPNHLEILLQYCEGITQSECEELRFSNPKLVDKLTICV